MRSVTGLLMVLVLCAATAAADGPFQYGRWTPVAIYADGVDAARLEVWTTGAVSKVQLYSGTTTVVGSLNDSGIDGDRVAGDGVWTIDGFTRTALGLEMIPGMTVTGFDIHITTGGVTSKHDAPSLGLVNRTNLAVTKVTADVFRTKWGAFFVDRAGAYFDGKMPVCDVRCGKGNELAFREFYKYFPDTFDFLVIMPFTPIYRPVTFAENVPYFVPVRSKVRNIGVPLEDRGAGFGSSAKLKGVIYHSFGYGAILDHEIGHAWGIRIGETLGFSGATSKYGTTYGWHFAAYSNQVGQMAAFPHLRLTDNGDGTWKAEQVMDRETKATYSPLELYLMGMIPPEQVPTSTPMTSMRSWRRMAASVSRPGPIPRRSSRSDSSSSRTGP
jgi:hypothetical protein